MALTKDEMALTSGLVSALPRSHQVGDQSSEVRLVQINADINPGNSGGPLLNEQGSVSTPWAWTTMRSRASTAAIHVDELSGFLQAQGVNVGHSVGGLLLGVVVLLSVLLVALLVLVFFLIRNEKKGRRAARRTADGRSRLPPARQRRGRHRPRPWPRPSKQSITAGHLPPKRVRRKRQLAGNPQGQTAKWTASDTPAAPEVPAPVLPQATTAQPAPPAAAPQEANGMQVQGQQTGSEASYSQAAPSAYPTPVAVSAPAPVPLGMTAAQATNNGQPQGQQAGLWGHGYSGGGDIGVHPGSFGPGAANYPPGPTRNAAYRHSTGAKTRCRPTPMQPPQGIAPPPPVWPVGNTTQPAAPAPKKKIRAWPIVTAIALCLLLGLGIAAAMGMGAYKHIISEVDTAVVAEDYAAVVAPVRPKPVA